jgi:hypothetical protein
MAKLSYQYALLDFDPGNPAVEPVEPISVTVTVDETFSPYVSATAVVATNSMPYSPDPRFPLFLGLRLQQDFGDLIYNYELTADYTGDVSAITAAFGGDVSDITRAYTEPWNIFEPGLPISTVTAAYGGDVSNLTAADLMEVWRMSDFLHSTGTFNPEPSTIFDGYLMLRTIEKDYISGETTLELTSMEALLLDKVGYPTDLIFTYTSLRQLINDNFVELEPGAADFTYSPAFGFNWSPSKTGWDYVYELATSAGLIIYSDEAGKWYLDYPGSVSGSLALKDDDNITALTSRIDRNSPNFFDYAIVEYRNVGSLPVYQNFGISGFPISKDRYFLYENLQYPGGNPAQELVFRGMTRGETYTVEAINNFDARPRQTLTIDVTGEPVKSGVIQSVTFSLPSARMSIDIRDLQEVI